MSSSFDIPLLRAPLGIWRGSCIEVIAQRLSRGASIVRLGRRKV